MAGRELMGRYRVGDVIGVGSFATVHRAVDERLDDTVVVKVLAENHSLNPEIRERFIAEGRALRRVASPHVVTVYDIGESDRQQPYLVLEHADRGTLAERVRELRAAGWTAERADVLAVARGLAAAVEAVHAARLVHRDLSPGNVLLRTGPDAPAADPLPGGTLPDDAPSAVVRPDERLVVADLGMCKDLALSSGLTVAGGTSGFRPPEQDGPGTVDTRADLWAMSALLAWLSDGADLPRALPRALRRSLAEAPARRHPDVAAWLADVEAALGPADEAPGTPAGPAAPRAGRRRRTATAAVVAVVLGAGVGLGAGLGAAAWLDDRPRASAGAAGVAISGPASAVVGEPVTLTAQVTGADHWVWTLPTGAYTADDGSVELTASTPGRAEVVLEARAPDGTALTAVHRLDVIDQG
ncbi:serine/threonine-protein kinase [Krasilnikoviella flava]|uniref:non-specific serine/threonine protein kinase n=1 Tax=Krasilnikoviella flava TaxID=526729 RepID=A0A1T5LIU8_9MICO|nr:serine/threonine-protein kinase [Krasilnikoviella flava]SKC75735.1 Protein kinase domain-containing protein [Krasilnikoviella flava]